MADEESRRSTVITAKTLIPAGAFLAAAASVFFAGVQVSKWEQRLHGLEEKLQAFTIENKADRLADESNRWTRDDARNWADALQVRNPGISVPIIR